MHLSVDISIGDLGLKVVEVNDVWRHQKNGGVDVFIICQVASEIEVFQIKCHQAAVGGANNSVEYEFGCLGVGSLGDDVSSVFNLFTNRSPLGALRVFFLWTIVAENVGVIGFLVFGNVPFVNK